VTAKQSGAKRVRVTPARRETSENIQLFLDRHGVSGLATALEYARDYVQGRVNARIMAREQDLPVLEASPDVDELDAAVDERRGE
jgi:hypothetical protein